MKKFLHILSAFIVLFVSCAVANAQSNPISPNNINIAQNRQLIQNRGHINALLQLHEGERLAKLTSTSKTTSILERVKAYSSYDFFLPDTVLFALGKTDTGYYIYNSTQRGSKFNYNTMGYEAPASYYDLSYPVLNLFSGQHVTYDGPYYHPDVMCDSARSWSSNAPDLTGKHLYSFAYADSIYDTYDSSNNIIVHYDQAHPTLMGKGYQYINSYDGSNKNTGSVSLLWNPSKPSFDSNNLMLHFYNISSKLAMDSLNNYIGGGVWTPAEKWTYNYDVSGNLIRAMYFYDSAGVWIEQQQYFMTYNTDNTIHTDSDIVLNGGTWIMESYNVYGYSEGISYYTSYESNKYTNNYEYNKTIYLLNSEKLLDNNFLLLREDSSLSSPIGVLFYEYYKNENDLKVRLAADAAEIQCIVSKAGLFPGSLPFGKSQFPMLWDYADGVDTMQFLLGL